MAHRVGQNPAKRRDLLAAQSENVTVVVVTYIPFLSGYYQHSLEVLKICLGSILANTDQPYDLMVFDNASCKEVIDTLCEMRDRGDIQYLLLSQKNIGKVGAWNFTFQAAPGEFIAYSDSDVYHFPGWLSRHLEVFEAFPEVGTVSGLPRRGRTIFCENTLRQVHDLPNAKVQIGKFMPEAWIVDHARSLGKLDQVEEDLKREDTLLERDGVRAYVTATHFQFMTRRELIRPFLPFSYTQPMGEDVHQLDHAIDGSGYLRLAVSDRVVLHMGNRADVDEMSSSVASQDVIKALSESKKSSSSIWKSMYQWAPIKRGLLAIYNRIFRIYFEMD